MWSEPSPLARNCVVELVGLEPTTRVLWNVGVSDQLTLSDTRHSSSKTAAIDGNFYNREIFGCRHLGMESPGVPRTTAAFFPPDSTTTGRLARLIGGQRYDLNCYRSMPASMMISWMHSD